MKFKPGESGNPNGRPKGTGTRQQLFNSLVDPHKEKLFQTAINLALAGNEAMLRLILERLMPAKPTQEPVAIEFIADEKKVDYLEACGYELIQAISDGDISTADALPLFKALNSQCKLMLHGTMAKQLNEIREKINFTK